MATSGQLRLKLLLDSNVVIAVEPFGGSLEPALPIAAELVRLASEQGHVLCVAPATRDDLLQGRDTARRAQRLAELSKFPELAEVPIPLDLTQKAGESALGTNDHRDLRILATLNSGAAHYLVTEDGALRRRASRAELGDAVLTLAEAVELLRGFAPMEITPPPRVSRIPSYALDGSQPVFDSLRAEYPDFQQWLRRIAIDSDNRVAFVVKDSGSYAAVALLKREFDCLYELEGPVTKISTFKVEAAHSGVKYGELLLKTIFVDSSEARMASLYTEVFPTHADLIAFLADFGFVDSGLRTGRGENVLVKSLIQPDIFDGDNLLFHIRFGPPALRSTDRTWLVPIQPHWHDQLFPEMSRSAGDPHQLSLFRVEEEPLTHPWGNALRKAYLCNSSTNAVELGDVLLFYRSHDTRAVQAIGVVEGVLRSQLAEQVVRYVGRRTVYTPSEVAELARSVRGVLAIRFRQDRFVDPPWSYEQLVYEGVLRGAPQQIMRVATERGRRWVQTQLLG